MIRHARTEWNEQGRIQGRTDLPLSVEGRKRALAWRLPGGARTLRWYVSPLERARETARQIGLSAMPDERLVEMCWGEWEGKRLEELRSAGLLTPEMEGLGLDLRPPGGESPRDVQTRLRPWLKEIGPCRRSLGAVTHNGVIRALYALASGWDMRSDPPVKLLTNCAHQFRISQDGTPQVEILNISL